MGAAEKCQLGNLIPEEKDAIILKLSEDDPLFHKKKKLLQTKCFDVEVRFPLKHSSNAEWIESTVKEMLQVSRILHLDEAELYFREDDTDSAVGYYTPKVELEALNSMLALVSSTSDHMHIHKDILQDLQVAIVKLISEFGDKNMVETVVANSGNCNVENSLVEWGVENGVQSKLKIAYVEGFGRGAIASEDLKIGDVALEIPLSTIISEEVLYESAMFPVLQKIEGISAETMLLFWSMKERHECSSKFKLYFETLPKEFKTGLSFGFDAIMELDGTLLLEELMQSKEHLRKQYDAYFPALWKEYPDIFPAELYTWDNFLWACELWYSNSMKIQFPDGSLRTCLMPIVGFLNHSLYPHILNYGKVDPLTNTMKFPLSRPCRAGEQCYLSYGNFSGSHLIMFYGFLHQQENPYDIIPLDIDCTEDDMDGCHTNNWTTHMVRDTCFSNNRSIFHYGLPSPLLDHLRRARNPSLDDNSPLQEKLEREIQILEDLFSTFSSMMEKLSTTDVDDRDNIHWDVKLAIVYKSHQRRILSSILSSCTAGLELVKSELQRYTTGDAPA